MSDIKCDNSGAENEISADVADGGKIAAKFDVDKMADIDGKDSMAAKEMPSLGVESGDFCEMSQSLHGVDTHVTSLQQLCRSRGGYASHVSRKYNDFLRAVKEKGLVSAKQCLEKLQEAFYEFEKAHCKYRNIAVGIEPDRLHHYDENYNQFKLKVQSAASKYEQLLLQDTITPNDSVSQHSGSSRSASRSKAVAKAQARRAALEAKAAYLKQRQEIEYSIEREKLARMDEEIRLKQELDRLNLEAEIHAAAAEEEVLATCTSDVSSPKPMTDTPKRSDYFKLTSKATVSSNLPLSSNLTKPSLNAGDSKMPEVHSNLNPLAQEWKSADMQDGYPRGQGQDLHIMHQQMQQQAKILSDCLSTVKNLQANAIQAQDFMSRQFSHQTLPQISSNQHRDLALETQAVVSKQLLEAVHLPKGSMMTYDGDPMSFWVFMNAFDSCVGSTSVSDSVKLNRLFEYCKGKAAKVIQPCALMEPVEGYNRARKLLKERFGNDFVISEAWINKVTDGPMIKPNNGPELQNLVDDLKGCLETLNAMDKLQEIDTRIRMVRIVERLPHFLQNRWRKEAVHTKETKGDYPGVRSLVEFLDRVSKEINDPIFGTHSRNSKPKTGKQVTSFSVKASEAEAKMHWYDRKCSLCENPHELSSCSKFKHMSPEKRLEFAKDKKLCFSCLKQGKHTIKWCKRRSICGIDGCTYKHSKLLHQLQKVNQNEAPVDSNGATVAESFACGLSTSNSSKVVLPIIAVKVKGQGQQKYISTYALLDPGSNKSFCSNKLVEKLEVEGQSINLSLSTLHSNNEVKSVGVDLDITALAGRNSKVINVQNVCSLQNFPSLHGNIASPEETDKWPHLKGISASQIGISLNEVSLLLGQDAPQAIRPLEVRSGSDYEPYAVRTTLGWVINGPMSPHACSNVAISNFVNASFEHNPDVTLSKQVEAFWKLDDIGVNEDIADRKQMSPDDKRALSIWENSAKKIDGHYQFDIPFKSYSPELPENRVVAEKRLHSLKRRLQGDPGLLEMYKNGIKDLLDKGFAEVVDDEDDASDGYRWYLPHHSVVNPNKPKIRIVFDGSAEYQGTSLNRKVLRGPDLTNTLVGVLLRFRENNVAIMGDIEAMFHQIKVTSKHRDVLRFVWYEDGDLTKAPKTYRMTVHLFGGIWSPSCANYALRRTALDQAELFDAKVVDTVISNFYLDDCLASVDTAEDAVKLVNDVCRMLKGGGFKLTKWVSSNKEVMESISVEDRAMDIKDLDLDNDYLPIQRALGVHWRIIEDVLCLKIQPKQQPMTRRGVLSVVSSIYDPLGFVAPFVLRAKKILRSVCRLSFGWDDELDAVHSSLWCQWLEELPVLKDFTCKRCILPRGFGNILHASLHHFSDASESAYGTVSYIRLVNADNQVHCTFLLSKSKLSPLKGVTIPRLELMAAVLAVKVDLKLRKELKTPIETSTFWTDSTIVLQYIKSTNKRFHTFVANRVSLIHDGSDPGQWRHIAGDLNPADDPSRGLNAKQLVDSDRWLHGPRFLSTDDNLWPHNSFQNDSLPDDDCEINHSAKVLASMAETPNRSRDITEEFLARFSCWFRLRKATAWLIRITNWLRKHRQTSFKQQIQSDEINNAELAIVKYLQSKFYQGELDDLVKKGSVSQGSSIHNLEPFFDEIGVARVGGRTINHPVILPRDHHVSELVVRYMHEFKTKHSGREHVLATTRIQYWIPRARALINKVIKKCVFCKRLRGTLELQKMADLPKERQTPSTPPFSYTGIDCFGPYYVKRGRSQEKRYGCLFTCLTIRAIHIEPLNSLTSDSFLNALSRFSARRGMPEMLRSDNGTNFTGAQKELYRTIKRWNEDLKTQKHLAVNQIIWKFNPPSAPHMGGIWERQVRTIKKVLDVVMKNQVLNDESLATMFCEVEAVINGRPITAVSGDVNDPEALTPNHLLLLRSGPTTAPGTFINGDAYGRKWRHIQYLADAFWKRWLREYIPMIQFRKKWLVEKRNIQPGDIVLVHEEGIPRRTWPLGRVMKVNSGSDGLVRSAEVKTRWTILTRPVTKLCLLEGNIER